MDTGVKVFPKVTKGFALHDYLVYKVPTGQDWRLPLLVSLLEIKDDQWVIEFDEETDKFSEDEVTSLVNNVCIN